MAEFTDRMREVLQCVADGMGPKQIQAVTGMSPQQVSNNLRKLRAGWYIGHRGDLPATATGIKAYPWEVIKDAPAPRLPVGAKLRAEYVAQDQRDMSVPPITWIRWGHWSVQGIPMLHPEGRPPKEQVPPERVVVMHLLPPAGVPGIAHLVFLGSRHRPWTEQDTAGRVAVLADADLAPLTLVIAAAIGVEAVLGPPG